MCPFRDKGHGRLCANNQTSGKIMLGTVTLKSWFSDPVIIRKKHQSLYTHIASLASKLINVLSHSGHRVTLALPKSLWCI